MQRQNIRFLPERKHNRAAKIEALIVRLRIPSSKIKIFLDQCDRFDYFKFGRHTIDLRGCE